MLVLLAVFITANVSGGHLNPAVTLATMVTGHIKITRGLAYIFLQICGACFGILMVVSIHAHTACLVLFSACPLIYTATPAMFIHCCPAAANNSF